MTSFQKEGAAEWPFEGGGSDGVRSQLRAGGKRVSGHGLKASPDQLRSQPRAH